MEFLNSLFGSKPRNQQDMTEEAARVFANTGMIDPRVYNPNIRFQTQTNPPEEMRFATAYVPFANTGTVNLVLSAKTSCCQGRRLKFRSDIFAFYIFSFYSVVTNGYTTNA